jgi:hypothetical protein
MIKVNKEPITNGKILHFHSLPFFYSPFFPFPFLSFFPSSTLLQIPSVFSFPSPSFPSPSYSLPIPLLIFIPLILFPSRPLFLPVPCFLHIHIPPLPIRFSLPYIFMKIKGYRYNIFQKITFSRQPINLFWLQH